MATEKFKLRLYITEASTNSARAMANLEKYLSEGLGTKYETEIINLSQNPELAMADQIIAVPTLIKRAPAPARVFIGDLSDKQKVIAGLQATL